MTIGASGRHNVFEIFVKWGKILRGNFFGFKLYLIINDKGELMHFNIMSGSTDDRTVVQTLTQGLEGWLFDDKEYLNKKLAQTLKA